MHLKKEGMRKKILDAVFFWAGYNNAVQAFIEKFGAWYTENHIIKIEKKTKIIKANGPHIRYQADIWYLPDALKKGNEYLYVLDLTEHINK